MNQRQATDAIFKRFRAAWPGLSSGVPYVLDNVASAETSDGYLATVHINSLDSELATLGPRAKVRRDGIVEVRLLGPTGVGRGRLDDLAEVVRQVFERRRLDRAPGEMGVVLEASSVAELRRDREAPDRWVLAVNTPFYFHQIRAQV